MNVHLRQIPADSTFHIEGEEDAGYLDLDQAGAAPLSPLYYSLDVGLSDGGLFATGRVAVKVQLRCVACLEHFDHEMVIDPFSLQKELDGREMVDLGPEVREDIQLALPAYPRCDADGRKTCPASFPKASDEATSPSGNAAWEALDKLKTDN